MHKENLDFFEAKRKAESQDEQNLEQVATSEDQLAELETIHPASRPNLFKALNTESTEFVNNDRQKHIELKSIDENLNEVELDTNRIVNSSVDLSMLQEYIPATKIKGLFNYQISLIKIKILILTNQFYRLG